MIFVIWIVSFGVMLDKGGNLLFVYIMKVGVKENQNGIIFFIMVFVVEKDLMVVIEFKIKGNINQILKVKKIVFLIV